MLLVTRPRCTRNRPNWKSPRWGAGRQWGLTTWRRTTSTRSDSVVHFWTSLMTCWLMCCCWGTMGFYRETIGFQRETIGIYDGDTRWYHNSWVLLLVVCVTVIILRCSCSCRCCCSCCVCASVAVVCCDCCNLLDYDFMLFKWLMLLLFGALSVVLLVVFFSMLAVQEYCNHSQPCTQHHPCVVIQNLPTTLLLSLLLVIWVILHDLQIQDGTPSYGYGAIYITI